MSLKPTTVLILSALTSTTAFGENSSQITIGNSQNPSGVTVKSNGVLTQDDLTRTKNIRIDSEDVFTAPDLSNPNSLTGNFSSNLSNEFISCPLQINEGIHTIGLQNDCQKGSSLASVKCEFQAPKTEIQRLQQEIGTSGDGQCGSGTSASFNNALNNGTISLEMPSFGSREYQVTFANREEPVTLSLK
jgi:hypothetical protein